MWYKKYFAIFFLILMINVQPVQPDAIRVNFTVKLLIPSDNTKFDTIAQALTQFWTPLQVYVETIGVTLPVYQSKLLSEDRDWDMAVIYYNFENDNSPILNEFYHPSSDLGNLLYHLDQSILEGKNSDSMGNFVENLENYENSIDYYERVKEIKKLQEIFNEELLYDIPLLNDPLLVSSLQGFDGFDIEEDILHSIFLGAYWDKISVSRSEDRADDELVYALPNIVKISNPLYAESREENLIVQSLYSSLFLEDKYNSVHPYLSTGYSHIIDASSSRWNITIRDDVVWSDGEVLDATDVKFTFDLNKFPWIQASGSESWKYLEEVRVLNQTTLSISFSQFTVNELSLLANEYIIPEHIYNTSFTTIDGESNFPYEGGFPGDSNEWVSTLKNPVTAGPYVIDSYKPGEFINLNANEHFWYPSEHKLPLPLNINSFAKPGSYYFNYDDDPLTTPIEETTQLKIRNLSFQFSDKSIIDPNSLLLLFDSGRRDFIEFDRIDSESKYLDDDNYQFYLNENKNSGIKILFNSQFEAVKSYDVRRAFSLSINRTKIKNVMGTGYQLQNTIVNTAFTSYYDSTYALYYDFDEARDLFRSNGLAAFDNTTVFSDAGNISFNIHILLFSIALLPIIKRKKVMQ